ncbi:hypothetical protein J6590_054200 [Homalodisca vitripennis]|nr:hypothetical protein J6590_054200 [Homalodisca vitripennis]
MLLGYIHVGRELFYVLEQRDGTETDLNLQFSKTAEDGHSSARRRVTAAEPSVPCYQWKTMDKTGTTYRYNPSFHGHIQHGMQKNNNGKTSLSRVQAHALGYHEDDSQTCFCFESDDDSADKIRFKNTKRKLARGCMSNLMICAILIGYTFIGAVIFLIVEGDSGFYSISSSGRSKIHSLAGQNRRPASNATWLAKISEESRTNTVDKIWNITVNLNILYRENWTRLMAQEISHFQEQLVQRLTEEMAAKNYPHDSRLVDGHQKVDWNLAKAFLYSLTGARVEAATQLIDGDDATVLIKAETHIPAPRPTRRESAVCWPSYGERIAAQFSTCKSTHVRNDTRPSWSHRARTFTDS